jgi:hypothetical protein
MEASVRSGSFLGAGLGTTIELWRDERVLFSGLVDVGFGNVLLVDLVKFAEDIIAVGPENASILTTDQGASVNAGVAAAWALNHFSGVTVLGELGYSDLKTRTEDLLWRIGGTGSIDFGQRDGAPVGLLVAVDIDHMKAQAARLGTAGTIGLGAFYTGREDLNIGVEAAWSRLPLETRDVTVNPMSFALVLRYFF